MARPERNDVDYFPFLCKEGKAMFIIESQYGNDGYATWVKILRLFAVTNYHFLNLKSETEVLFIASKCKVDKQTLLKIITTLVEIGEFDAELWEQNILWSEKFTLSIKDAYLKRGNKLMFRDELMQFLMGLGLLKPVKSIRKSTKDSIVEDIIINNTKENNSIDSRKLKFASTLEPFLTTYGKDFLNDFYKYWTEPNNSNTKFRRELQKTWDLERRLNTWSKNEKNFKGSEIPKIKEASIRGTERAYNEAFNIINNGNNEH